MTFCFVCGLMAGGHSVVALRLLAPCTFTIHGPHNGKATLRRPATHAPRQTTRSPTHHNRARHTNPPPILPINASDQCSHLPQSIHPTKATHTKGGRTCDASSMMVRSSSGGTLPTLPARSLVRRLCPPPLLLCTPPPCTPPPCGTGGRGDTEARACVCVYARVCMCVCVRILRVRYAVHASRNSTAEQAGQQHAAHPHQDTPPPARMHPPATGAAAPLTPMHAHAHAHARPAAPLTRAHARTPSHHNSTGGT